MPSYTVGRRVLDKENKIGVDLYFTYAVKKNKTNQSHSSYDYTYLLPIEYLSPFKKLSNFYYGIGGGLGGFKHKATFHGIVATSKTGYEFLRKNKIASFIQLNTIQPIIPITYNKNRAFLPIFSLFSP